jgi:hypothetical protein
VAEGQHRNPTNRPDYFTTAFFHHPEEFKAEVEDAGWRCERVVAIEGPGWLLPDFAEHWHDRGRRERLLTMIRLLETEASLLGVSSHIMAIARKAG